MPKTTTVSKWKAAVEHIDAHKELGQTDIYLGHEETDLPWQFATKCEPGGSHRLEIHTNVWITAEHPSGLTFKWSFDIEPYSANGSGSYQVNVSECRRVLALMPTACRRQFQDYLESCANAVEKSAQKYRRVADDEQATADALREAATKRIS